MFTSKSSHVVFFSAVVAFAASLSVVPSRAVAADSPANEKANAYVLSIQAPDDARVGKQATVTVTIKANEGFKINKGYPAKLKLAQTEGLSFDKRVLRKSDAEMRDHGHTLVFPVRYTQQKNGSVQMTGKLKFSVCSPSRCMMERKTIKATLKAK